MCICLLHEANKAYCSVPLNITTILLVFIDKCVIGFRWLLKMYEQNGVCYMRFCVFFFIEECVVLTQSYQIIIFGNDAKRQR